MGRARPIFWRRFIISLGAATFRGGKKTDELIKLDRDFFRLSGEVIRERRYEIDISANRQKKKQIKINSVLYKKSVDLYGILQVVLFSPDDLKIVKGSPDERRLLFRYVAFAV